MKKQTTNLYSPLSKEETAALTAQVKESVAEMKYVTKTFGALDLWNIHRQRRVAAVRRY